MKEVRKNKKTKQDKLFSNKNAQKIKINIKKKNIEPYIIKEMQQTYGSFKLNNNNVTYDKKITNSFSFISSISTIQDEQKLNKTIKQNQNKEFKLKYNINTNNSNSKEINHLSRKKHLRPHVKNRYSKIVIDKEVDKFKNSINNLMKIIENFENEYINSSKPKLIKEQLNQITNNRTYFLQNDFNKSSLLNFKDNGNKILVNKRNNKPKQTINNINKNNTTKSNYNSTIPNINNINNKNFLSETFSPNKNEINTQLKLTEVLPHKENKKYLKNSHLSNLCSGNAYDRRINYSLLISKKINNHKNKINKNIINNTKTALKNGVNYKYKKPKEIEDNVNCIISNKNKNYDYRRKYKHVSSKTNIDKKWNEIRYDDITNTVSNTREIYFNSPNKTGISQNINYILNRRNKKKNRLSKSVHLSSGFNKVTSLNKVKVKKTIKHKSCIINSKSTRNIF